MLPSRPITHSHDVQISTLTPAHPFPPPHANLCPVLRKDWPLEIPARHLYQLKNVSALSHHGQIQDAEGFLLTGHSPTLRHSPPTALSARINLQGKGLLLTSPSAWKNYSHWLLSTFCKTRLLVAAQYDYILAPFSRPFHQAALAALPSSPRIIPLNKDSHYHCQQLDLMNTFSLGLLHPVDVQWLRAVLMPNSMKRTQSNRLYLSRANNWRRRILNETALHPYLSKQNFQIIDPGSLSLSEQALTFAQAQHIIAPHGAALANLLFAPPQCSVLELFPQNYLRPYFAYLTACLGLNYHAIIAPNPPDAPDYQIMPSLLFADFN